MIQAFTDLVGTSAVPALSINIEELTELTPALETAAVDHGTSLEASEAPPSTPESGCFVNGTSPV
jgi:hypothetical protein